MKINIFLNLTYIFTISMILSIFPSASMLTINLDEHSSVDNTIVFTITNTSNIDINLSKKNIPYQNIISHNIFNIMTYNNTPIPYIGKLIKYNPNHTEYMILEANESYSTDIHLSDYYDIPSNERVTILYKKDILEYEIKQSVFSMFTSSKQRFFKALKKVGKVELKYNQCIQTQINIINDAKSLAYHISQNAYHALMYAKDNTQAERYITWFGSANVSRQNHVKSSLKHIYDVLKEENIKFDCSCSEPYYAYVYPTDPYNIYLCSGFWNAELSGTDSQSGTIIHQLSYFNKIAATKSYSFGEYEAKNLAIEFPNYTIINADSYEYFTQNTPFLPMPDILAWLVPLLLNN